MDYGSIHIGNPKMVVGDVYQSLRKKTFSTALIGGSRSPWLITNIIAVFSKDGTSPTGEYTATWGGW